MVIIAVLCLFFAVEVQAQTETTFVARVAAAPEKVGYRLVEGYTTLKSGWIPIDMGYIDFRNAKEYREIFVGAGKVVKADERNLVVGELYFVQSGGPASGNARYLQPWILAQRKIQPTLKLEGNYFMYVPLNDLAITQHVIDRIRLEKDLPRNWRIGAGYGAYGGSGLKWDHRPFVYVGRSTKIGNFEVWLQKFSSGVGIQLRYDVTLK